MYIWKKKEELLWAAGVAASVFLLELLSTADLESVTNWKKWIIALGAGLVRAVAGALLSQIRKPEAVDTQ